MIIIYKKFKQFTDGIFNIDLTYSWVRALWIDVVTECKKKSPMSNSNV